MTNAAEIQPTLTSAWNGGRNASDEFIRSDPTSDLGLNVRLGFTSLTLDGTWNPDFSQVEADAGQVTLNQRFALFFEERRQFFLEGIELFSTPNQLVYTRTIGEPQVGVKLTGKFIGSGPMVVKGTFRPEKPTPDFDLYTKIVKTKVESFNNILRAYGGMDTQEGTFAFFSELSVKNDQIHGYVKPLLKDVEVYDSEQDKDKPLTKKLYEAVVGGVLGLLENKPRHEAVTMTDVSGPVENPHASTWQVLGNLIQNAFFKAILPGFERQAGQGKGKR